MTVPSMHGPLAVRMCDHRRRMASVPGATELLPVAAGGRSFLASRSVRLGDVDPRGVLRLDATARYLQDVASDDVADADLDGAWGWMVRRTLIEVRRPAVLDESLDLVTYCTGMGRSWAERTTVAHGSNGADIATVSVWVQIAADSGRPAPLTEQFVETYGTACGDRRVSARLSLGGPPSDAERQPWTVRRSDLDPFEHVNNAANWAFLEEAIAPDTSRLGRGEMEFVGPVTHGMPLEMCLARSDATSAWIVSDTATLSAARWSPR